MILFPNLLTNEDSELLFKQFLTTIHWNVKVLYRGAKVLIQDQTSGHWGLTPLNGSHYKIDLI